MGVAQSEKQVENHIKKWLTDNNYWHFKVHGGPFQRAGVPDIIACINGRFVGIEVKRPKGGRTSAIQEYNIDGITQSGGIAFVATSVAEVITNLKRLNVI